MSGRVLALDFGAARTGVAITDPSGTVAAPLDLVAKANSSGGLATIARLVAEHDVVRVVVGLPLALGGHDTVQTQRTRSFADRLAKELEVPVELFDERYTSRMADQTAAASGSGTSRDSLAACHLLTSWMETHGT